MSNQLLIEVSRAEVSRALSLQSLALRTAADILRWVWSMARWSEIRRVRQHLAKLDDHLLADIGLSRKQVIADAKKWPWQR